MINRLCKRLNQNIEVRQSLSSLRQEIKDSSKRELLLSWIHDGDLDLSVFLENEDAKTRKNAALLIGDLALSSESDAVFHAYQTEDTRFVKEAYLTALKSLNAAPYVDVFRKRYEELSLYEASDDEKKHVEHELHALSELINTIEPFKKHRFLGGRQTFHCIFRTNPLHPEITAALMEESSAASSKMGVRVKTNHLNRLLPIRTYNELLFQIPGMVSCKPDADVAASVIAGSNLMALLENTHEGDFYFRIGVKSRMALSERSKFAKKVASKLEELTAHKLRNSTSHYEFEIRMIEGKSGDYYLLVKLNTIVDRRFSYREEFIPTSIKPVNAALLVELAKDYMIPDAQILDPFCGVGTMLIERQKVVKGILLMVSIILQKPLRKRSITQILQTRSFIISIRIVLHLPMTILLMKSLRRCLMRLARRQKRRFVRFMRSSFHLPKEFLDLKEQSLCIQETVNM